MRFFIICVLIAVLNNDSTATAENPPSSEGGNGRNNVKITDLDMDSLYIIAEMLDFMDFLHLVQLDRKLSYVATETWRRKYNTISIVRADYIDKYYRRQFNEKPGKRVELHNFSLIKDILKHFGCVLKRCSVAGHNIKPDRAPIVSEYINRYASNSLEYLSMGPIREDTLQKFTQPFNELKELSLDVYELKQIKTGNLSLSQMCPKLKKLTMFFDTDVDYSYFAEELPHMDDLYVAISDRARNQSHQIEEFLRLNSQIKTCYVQYAPHGFVEAVAKFLPNILNLTLLHVGNDTAHFEYVTHFEMLTYDPIHVERITFSNVESLKLRYAQVNFNSWIEFFHNNQNISKLHMFLWYDDNVVPLVELTAELPNLIEMKFDSSSPVSVDTIIQFIENHEKLMIFQFTIAKFELDDFNMLRVRFENEWRIQEIENHWKGFSFERIL